MDVELATTILMEALGVLRAMELGESVCESEENKCIDDFDKRMEALLYIVQDGKLMHWLPMSEDAVFEDGGKYTIRYESPYAVPHARYESTLYNKDRNVFVDNGGEVYEREYITHYARITEPK